MEITVEKIQDAFQEVCENPVLVFIEPSPETYTADLTDDILNKITGVIGNDFLVTNPSEWGRLEKNQMETVIYIMANELDM